MIKRHQCHIVAPGPARRAAGFVWLAAAVALLAGCRKEEIQVYRVPRETEKAAPATPMRSMANKKVRWQQLPVDWKEQPAAKFRSASFTISGPDGQDAEVAAIPFPGMGGSDLQLINLWRDQLGLAPATEADAASQTAAVTIGGDTGKLFDLAAEKPSGTQKYPVRIITAVLKNDGMTWFFKLAGDAPLVAAQKTAFLDFLKTITFEAGAAESPAPPPSAEAAQGKPEWTVPANWQEQPPSQMLLAKFAIAADNAKAEVTVSAFPGDVGGLLANVNRWRGQLGLQPVAQPELEKTTTHIDPPAGHATLVDFTGTDVKTGKSARLVGVIQPLGGRTWFYKMMGDDAAVAREKDAFVAFVHSAKHP